MQLEDSAEYQLVHARLKKRVAELLLPKHELALQWVFQFQELCHLVDDIIDERITDPEVVLKMHQLTVTVFTSEFFYRYRADLYPIQCLITNVYADSVNMEQDKDTPWKQSMFDGLRNISNEMFSHIVGLLCGWEAKREISMLLREDSYYHHHTKEGKPC